MKKIITSILIASFLLSGCGRPLQVAIFDGPVVVGEKIYPTYGFINQDTEKSSKICYEFSLGNIVWSILLVETIIAPVYFIGFSLFNPVRVKKEGESCNIDQST